LPAAKKNRAPIIIAICIAITGIAAAVIIVATGIFNSDTPPQEIYIQASAPPEISNISTGDTGVLNPAQVFAQNKDAAFQIYVYVGGRHVGWGSGFFIDSSGIAVTNHHVLNGMDAAEAVLYDGSRYEITGYYSYDIENDLAIIQVDNSRGGFDAVTMGRSDSVNVGDRVYAIGGPGGDPLTLTEGIISRFANEPLSYDIYTVAGMLQSTAFIYGGNSGGPLFNDHGHVIGINSAGHIERESTQYAVPSNRVVPPQSGAPLYSLPVGAPPASIHRNPGQISVYDRYPFIPDFRSVSYTASLILSGTAEDVGVDLFLDIDRSGVFNFDYAFYYSLEERHFIPDTDDYDIVLENNGFIFQGIEITEDIDDVTYVFLYHPGNNVSLVYSYYWEYEVLFILIGTGNAYDQLMYYGYDYDYADSGSFMEMLYEVLVYDPEGMVLEIYWEDGRMTVFFYDDYTEEWLMFSRAGGDAIPVDPTFSYWNGIIFIGFPTSNSLYNLYEDFTGFFGDEWLEWSWDYVY